MVVGDDDGRRRLDPAIGPSISPGSTVLAIPRSHGAPGPHDHPVSGCPDAAAGPRIGACPIPHSLPTARPTEQRRDGIKRENFAIRRQLRDMSKDEQGLERKMRALATSERNAKKTIERHSRVEHWGREPERPWAWRAAAPDPDGPNRVSPEARMNDHPAPAEQLRRAEASPPQRLDAHLGSLTTPRHVVLGRQPRPGLGAGCLRGGAGDGLARVGGTVPHARVGARAAVVDRRSSSPRSSCSPRPPAC